MTSVTLTLDRRKSTVEVVSSTPQEDQAFASAFENACDRLFPGVTVLTPEQDEIATAAANEEIAWS